MKKKIIWRTRRGLLENDIIFSRFFSKYHKDLTEGEWHALEELLNRGDNELLDILLGRVDISGKLCVPAMRSLIFKLRSC